MKIIAQFSVLHLVSVVMLWAALATTSVLAQPVTYRFEETNTQNSKLVGILQDHQIFDRLKRFSAQNLQLKAEVSFILYEGEGLFFDAAKNEVLIPYASLLELYDGISAKYPQQSEVVQRIFSSAVEQMLWFEFGRVLVSQYALPILGREEYTLDNFSTLMRLNLGDLESEFILDAAEHYLVMEDTKSLRHEAFFQNEIEFDQHRYRMIVCMVLGRDNVPPVDLLAELAWDKERLEWCRQRYLSKLNAWYSVLLPYLKPDNPMQRWLNAWPPVVPPSNSDSSQTVQVDS